MSTTGTYFYIKYCNWLHNAANIIHTIIILNNCLIILIVYYITFCNHNANNIIHTIIANIDCIMVFMISYTIIWLQKCSQHCPKMTSKLPPEATKVDDKTMPKITPKLDSINAARMVPKWLPSCSQELRNSPPDGP